MRPTPIVYHLDTQTVLMMFAGWAPSPFLNIQPHACSWLGCRNTAPDRAHYTCASDSDSVSEGSPGSPASIAFGFGCVFLLRIPPKAGSFKWKTEGNHQFWGSPYSEAKLSYFCQSMHGVLPFYWCFTHKEDRALSARHSATRPNPLLDIVAWRERERHRYGSRRAFM